ncbi:MAG: hypothetical protein M1825_004930 [Sarcosagium campestre]|nr:MAG: hypothetical protein M1825_004930 [Sarcosagium campestre]
MPSLNLAILPDGVGKIHDALLCLARFSDFVSLEARRAKLVLTALNPSKSAYASFTLDGNLFFSKYQFSSGQARGLQAPDAESARFSCRALLAVFRGRVHDVRDKDTAIERCELSIQDRPDKTECRIVVKMICRHGVVKTNRLTYESVEMMHALFDKNAAPNRWLISSATLKEFIEHFGPKTEQLDIFADNGRASFTSYTEKITDGKEILKQPLQTIVAIDTAEFEEFSVEEKLHIAISVKDFKAIVIHAESLRSSVSARYSRPTRPMLLSYEIRGMLCEFTLMTIGDFRGGSATPAPVVPRTDSTARSSVRAHPAASEPPARPITRDMPPPAPVPRRNLQREETRASERFPSPPPPRASLDHQSLFFPEGDDDRRWDDHDYGDEDGDTLGWDTGVNDVNTALALTERSHADLRR